MDIEYQLIDSDSALCRMVDEMIAYARSNPLDWQKLSSEIKGRSSKDRIPELMPYSRFYTFDSKHQLQVTASFVEDDPEVDFQITIIENTKQIPPKDQIGRTVAAFFGKNRVLTNEVLPPYVFMFRGKVWKQHEQN